MALTILAQITAEPGKEALVRAELEKLVPITRAEAGCIQYDRFCRKVCRRSQRTIGSAKI